MRGAAWTRRGARISDDGTTHSRPPSGARTGPFGQHSRLHELRVAYCATHRRAKQNPGQRQAIRNEWRYSICSTPQGDDGVAAYSDASTAVCEYAVRPSHDCLSRGTCCARLDVAAAITTVGDTLPRGHCGLCHFIGDKTSMVSNDGVAAYFDASAAVQECAAGLSPRLSEQRSLLCTVGRDCRDHDRRGGRSDQGQLWATQSMKAALLSR